MTVSVPQSRPRPRPSSRAANPRKLEKLPPSIFIMLFSFFVFIAYAVSLTVALATASAEVWGALLLLPVLILLGIPLCRAAGRAENDPRLTRLLTIALVAKMLGACVRYAVAFNVYGGEADAKAYNAAGKILAANFRAGQLNFGTGAITDTHFIEVLTGIVYAIIGNTMLGGFFVFSFMGFVGAYFYYRAFAIAMPNGDHRRYALLVFFLPSLLFWSSSIGKDAWITLTLGAVAYGAARAFARKPFGFVFIALGAWGTEVVRPHMALLILGGMFPAYLIGHSPQGNTKNKQFLKIFGAIILVMAISTSIGAVEQKFKVNSVDTQAQNQVFDNTEKQTTQGGSAFTPARVHNPIQLPWAFITVMFRPFPYEASTTQGYVSAFEGMFLIGIALVSWRRIVKIPKEMVTSPYVMFALVYALIFVYAFSTIGNFGILVRQRVQVYPLFFVLLCLPKPQKKAGKKHNSLSAKKSYVRTR